MPALPFFRVELGTGYSSGPERGKPWTVFSPSVTDRPLVVELVAAQVVLPLRRAVLRPHHPVETSWYAGDDDPRSAHAAVRRRDGEVVAVGTVLPGPPPWEPQRRDGWRIRGMATRDEARRRGLGAMVLAGLLDHVAGRGGGLVWCNARVPAQALYRRAGFMARGPVFDIVGIGPHIQMWRTVATEHHGAGHPSGGPQPAVST
jgi:GNAT superfamily N-acetyltransferase